MMVVMVVSLLVVVTGGSCPWTGGGDGDVDGHLQPNTPNPDNIKLLAPAVISSPPSDNCRDSGDFTTTCQESSKRNIDKH